MCLEIILQLPLLLYQHYYWLYYKAPVPLVLELLHQNNCGVSNYNVSQLIINGVDAPRNAWPWHVFVWSKGGMCGGSIIDREWILTAGHCLTGEDTYVFLGEVDFKHFKTPYRNVSEQLLHVKYDDNPLQYDIGLLKLKTPIEFSDTIRPVCLPEGNIWDSSPCFVTGYGQMTTNDSAPDEINLPTKLQQLRVDIMNQSLCMVITRMFDPPYNDYTVCIDAPEKSGVFKGDSGGPLSCFKNGRFYVVGLASTAPLPVGIFDSFFPPIYMSVPHFMDWIGNFVNFKAK
ncbi:chymotrypsinogen B-like [Physella acuta]|uniref:chymotrypsinogen B-like n=1 Tax=Physella acuta TaxID=109671 RepID=UPI0027DBD073|nr:chymotrypsinogen B-like [Physella acuta]